MGFFDILRRLKLNLKGEHSPAGKHRQSVVAKLEEWCLGQRLLDDFVVQGVLGEGGMGKVYLVKSETTGIRFAVKRAKGLSEDQRRNFLAELQTWIDLPEHPNLVPCRFFRTVGDEVVIFADYAHGGSLKNWIDSRKLYEGGIAKTLERILDTTIQFAWGLHCVHELGLVHQDVKPANVMIDKDARLAVQGLKARVTDYGLARARAAGGEQYLPELGRSILVSSGGFTPAYCSPEQACGRKLDRRTDVWSWGVSVLEMFCGGVSWQWGSGAAEALKAFLARNRALPNGLEELLNGCFRKDPAERWQTFEIVVQKLTGIFRAATGTDYGGCLFEIQRKTAAEAATGERRGRGTSWIDPREWLKDALRAEGRDPTDAEEIVRRHVNSRRGELVADVAAYDDARRMYERLIDGGRKDLDYNLAHLCNNAALVHETAGDSSGAFALYDQAINIIERLLKVGGQRELASDLADFYRNKALLAVDLGDSRSAVGLYNRGIEILEAPLSLEDRPELTSNLAMLYSDKANLVMKLGDSRSAVGLYNRGIEILERSVNLKDRRELFHELALLYMNNANAVMNLGDNQSAVTLYDRSIEIFERLINVEGQRQLSNDLARVYSNKAVALGDLGDHRAALDLCNRAIKIRERLVHLEGQRELAQELASVYTNAARSAMELGDNQSAVCLCDRGIEILERLVKFEGQRQLADDLARLCGSKAIAVEHLGSSRLAIKLHNQAIEIFEHLVNVDGRRELSADMAHAYTNKASTLWNLRDYQVALNCWDRAIRIRERLVSVEGRSESIEELARLYSARRSAVTMLGETGRQLSP